MGCLGWIYNHHYRGGMRDWGAFRWPAAAVVWIVDGGNGGDPVTVGPPAGGGHWGQHGAGRRRAWRGGGRSDGRGGGTRSSRVNLG